MKTKNTDVKIKVLLLITGSIAAVKIPLLVSQLAKENYEIKCVLTKNAEKLIKPLSLKQKPLHFRRRSMVFYSIITFAHRTMQLG